MQSIHKLAARKRNKSQLQGATNAQGPDNSFVSEKESVPEPPSRPSQGDWSCEKEAYRYPIDSDGTSKDPWERCYDAVYKNDEALCQDVDGEISSLLVVASLFLAIVTTFTIESFKWLKPDQEQTMTTLLGDIVSLLNNTGAQGTAPNRTQLIFVPNNHDIVVNQLWFLSMTLSLSAVVVGTLCLQWLSVFRRSDVKHKPHDDALALRQLRYEGFIGWGVTRVPAILLLTVQGALVLFAIGLLYLLWSTNKRVAIPVAIVSGVSVVLLTLTTFMPLLQSVVGWIIPPTLAIPQCPYKSPISWVVHRGAVLLSLIVTLPFILFPYIPKKMKEWHREQFTLLTDYLWQEYDDLRRRQRESWGPQSSKQGSDKYSYYLVHGLASAMDTLVFQPSSVHIIHKCLQDFHGTSAEVETFEDLFGKDFNPAEEALLKADYSRSSVTSGENKHLLSSRSQHLDTLRRDFLNAIALQHFVTHNQKLHRTLLPHRVELYIRIKNSSHSLWISKHQSKNNCFVNNGDENEHIGSSIECPIRSLRDAQGLSPELRTQFLRCAERLVLTDWFGGEDRQGVDHVLSASQDGQSGSTIQDNKGEPEMSEKHLSVPSEEDRPLMSPWQEGPHSSMPSQNGGRSNAEQNHGVFGSEHPSQHTVPPGLNRDDTLVQNSPQSDASLRQSVREKLNKVWPGTSDPEVSPEPKPNDSFA